MKPGARLFLDTTKVKLTPNVLRFGRKRGAPIPSILAVYYDTRYMQVAAICIDCGFITPHAAIVEHDDIQKAAEKCDEFRAYCGFELGESGQWICATCAQEQGPPL